MRIPQLIQSGISSINCTVSFCYNPETGEVFQTVIEREILKFYTFLYKLGIKVPYILADGTAGFNDLRGQFIRDEKK